MYILEPSGNLPIKESNRNPSIDWFDNRKEQFVRFLTLHLRLARTDGACILCSRVPLHQNSKAKKVGGGGGGDVRPGIKVRVIKQDQERWGRTDPPLWVGRTTREEDVPTVRVFLPQGRKVKVFYLASGDFISPRRCRQQTKGAWRPQMTFVRSMVSHETDKNVYLSMPRRFGGSWSLPPQLKYSRQRYVLGAETNGSSEEGDMARVVRVGIYVPTNLPY